MALISVIIPTYKRRDMICQTLESVFAQTFKDYEVIVVDDGSPDDTQAVLAPYIQSGRIRYIKQPNAGPCAARNHGFAESNGEFVAFLDDDDLWPADNLEYQLGLMRKTTHAIVGGQAALLENGKISLPPLSDTIEIVDTLSAFSSTPFYSSGQVLFRRSAIEKVGGFDVNNWSAGDYDIYIRISLIGSIARYNRCSLYYRVHQNSMSTAPVNMFWDQMNATEKNAAAVDPGRRKLAGRLGYVWAFRHTGRKAVKGSVAGPQRNFSAAAHIASTLVLASIRDPMFGIRIVLDLIPLPLRNSLRSLVPRRITS